MYSVYTSIIYYISTSIDKKLIMAKTKLSLVTSCEVLCAESGDLYGSETQTVRIKEEKYLESFEMWLRKRMWMSIG